MRLVTSATRDEATGHFHHEVKDLTPDCGSPNPWVLGLSHRYIIIDIHVYDIIDIIEILEISFECFAKPRI